ncbi:MAG: hypothetical protein JWR88_2066, partial [Pseudonocardia sp.]|nr:hypothetical protein [Pseudonocardia sp.]
PVSWPVAHANINSVISFSSPEPAPAWVAVGLAMAAAGIYAQGARRQHRAVRAVGSGDGGTLGWPALRRLLRDRGWLRGLLLLGAGTGLQLAALCLAPLTIVHPVGVLALTVTATLDARAERRPLGAASIKAIIACSSAVGLFVAFAAINVTPRYHADPAADATRVVLLLAAVTLIATSAGLPRSGRWSCLAWTTGAGTSFGFAAVLTRIVAEQVAANGLTAAPPVALAGLLAAVLLGGWCLQQAHANGSTAVVVAGLTVIDPIVAVGLALAVLGEGAGIGTVSAVAMLCCAIGAAAAVVVLTHRRVETTAIAGVGR